MNKYQWRSLVDIFVRNVPVVTCYNLMGTIAPGLVIIKIMSQDLGYLYMWEFTNIEHVNMVLRLMIICQLFPVMWQIFTTKTMNKLVFYLLYIFMNINESIVFWSLMWEKVCLNRIQDKWTYRELTIGFLCYLSACVFKRIFNMRMKLLIFDMCIRQSI